MGAFRAILFLLLLAAGGFFAAFAWTGKPQYKRYGVLLLKWTVFAALGFFAVLFVQRLLEG